MRKNRSVIHHIALYVEDIKKETRLFEQAFGMSITEIDGNPENPKQVWLDGGIQLIAEPREKGCAIAHLALTTAEPEENLPVCREYGGETLPKGDNWLGFPDGLVLELILQKTEEP